jgi:hypothetical protein
MRGDRPRHDRWSSLRKRAKPLGKHLLEHALQPAGQVVLRRRIRDLDDRRLLSRRLKHELTESRGR